MFSLMKPLDMLAVEMTSFKTFDWVIWLSCSLLTSCFMDMMSSSFAVLNKKWNNQPKGNKDLFFGSVDIVNQVKGHCQSGYGSQCG